jgi:shikimate dehydrogenase
MSPLSGGTRLAAVIGDPIRHSRSPAIFNAAFEAAGLDWAFLAFEVPDGQTEAALAGAGTLGLAGLSVTMPHKTAMAAVVDEVTDTARGLGAVNCVAWSSGRSVGHNTDGAGFLASLAHDGGFDPAGASCVVLGAGGAARAIVRALAGAGAAEVVVVNRTVESGRQAAALAGPIGRVGDAGDLGGAELVVNATSVGMDGHASPVAAGQLGPGQLVVDAIYEPSETPLLREAAARGARTLGGLGMLVHQAAEAFVIWTGEPAPVEVMVRAARRH